MCGGQVVATICFLSELTRLMRLERGTHKSDDTERANMDMDSRLMQVVKNVARQELLQRCCGISKQRRNFAAEQVECIHITTHCLRVCTGVKATIF